MVYVWYRSNTVWYDYALTSAYTSVMAMPGHPIMTVTDD